MNSCEGKTSQTWRKKKKNTSRRFRGIFLFLTNKKSVVPNVNLLPSTLKVPRGKFKKEELKKENSTYFDCLPVL